MQRWGRYVDDLPVAGRGWDRIISPGHSILSTCPVMWPYEFDPMSNHSLVEALCKSSKHSHSATSTEALPLAYGITQIQK